MEKKTLFGIPVIVSEHVPENTVIVAPREIWESTLAQMDLIPITHCYDSSGRHVETLMGRRKAE